METVRAPAEAYGIVAGMLPPDYFEKPPPAAGARLNVLATDGVGTQRDMDVTTAQRLMDPLRMHPQIVRVIPSRYTDRARQA